MNTSSLFETNSTDRSDSVSFGFGEEDNSLKFQQIGTMLYNVCAPIILSLGTFGNIMTIVVVQTMKGGQSTSTMAVYFTALAVSDLIILYSGIFRRWLQNVFGFYIVSVNDFFCKTVIFLVYTCGMTSSWFLVAVTLQRVTSVMFPHRVELLCTRRKSQVIVVMIAICFALLNSHLLFLYTVKTSDKRGRACLYNDNEQLIRYDLTVYPWFDLMFSAMVPFFILIMGNSVLVWKVAKSVSVARQMTTQKTNDRQKRASSLTVTVICISLTFLLLTSPLCALLIMERDSGGYGYAFSFAWYFCNLLWYVNSAVNFYLYCLTGSKFRSQLRQLFCGVSGPRAAMKNTRNISMTLSAITTGVSRVLDSVDESADF